MVFSISQAKKIGITYLSSYCKGWSNADYWNDQVGTCHPNFSSVFEHVCHKEGTNVIIPEKNLKKETLERNGMNTLEAIIYQITNGKNGMPAFGGRLKQEEIENIASYVLDESYNNFEK